MDLTFFTTQNFFSRVISFRYLIARPARAFGLLVSTFCLFYFVCQLLFFYFPPSDFSDSGWRMAWFGIGSWLWEIPFGSGSLRNVSV